MEIYPKTFHYFQAKEKEKKEAIQLLKRKLQILKKLDYIKENTLTKKGEFASYIYGYELPLTEIYNQRFLDRVEPIELNILISSLVFEPRKGQRLHPLSRTCKKIKEKTEEITQFIHNLEKRYRISPLSKGFYSHITSAIEAYTRGADFSRVRDFVDIDEGELVRFFHMTIQILRKLYSCPVIEDILKETISKSIRSINKDIIDAEKQIELG